MPEISGENVEEANRRQNRSGQCLLLLPVAFDDLRVGDQSNMNKLVRVIAIKSFVETQLITPWQRMQGNETAERPIGFLKKRRRKADENSKRENDRETDDVDPTTRAWH